MRKNLFGSWYDTILTILGAWIIYWAVKGFLTWVFTVRNGRWSPQLAPVDDRSISACTGGRLWLASAFLMFLTGNSLAIWARRSYFATILLLAMPGLLALLPFGDEPRKWLIILTCHGAGRLGDREEQAQVLKRL
jgi:hypothetical protein